MQVIRRRETDSGGSSFDNSYLFFVSGEHREFVELQVMKARVGPLLLGTSRRFIASRWFFNETSGSELF